MPKKRHLNFRPLQGSASTSSSSSDKQDASPSVNERLNELRKLEGKDAAAKRRQLAESVNQRSVPPDAQRLLGISESAPPKPKGQVNARARDRLRGTPGPAPPRSWVKGGGTGGGWVGRLAVGRKGGGAKAKANECDRDRPKQLLRFAQLTGLEDDHEKNGEPASLAHLALKTVAKLWDGFDEEDYPALVEIPLRLRLRLLSYIVFYGPAIDAPALKALLQGNDSVQHLDLAALVGYRGLSLRKIQKCLELIEESASQKDGEYVLDSWDGDESLESALQPSVSQNRFSQLTHLCLSHPNVAGASWKDLLSLSKHTPQLTHLSLAYWPRPTLTPNLTTATVSTPDRQEVSAGGSHYYSAIDSDMEEPAALIRQLSSNLLCLKWLDLEGCSAWVSTLARLAAEIAPEVNFAHDRHIRWMDNGERWEVKPPKVWSIFLSNWKNLSHVRCAQGCMPDLTGFGALLEDGHLGRMERKIVDQATAHLHSNGGELQYGQEPLRDVVDVQKRRTAIWVQQEEKAMEAALRIIHARRMRGAGAIAFDHGWTCTKMSFAASGY